MKSLMKREVFKINTNIAFIIPYLTDGGAERVVATLSLNMPENYNVYIITYQDKENKYPHKGTVININSSESNNILGKIWNTIERIYKIKKIKKKYNIEKTMSFLDNPNIINILSRYKDKVVISIRNQKSKEIEAGKKKLQKSIIKNLYNKADKIVAISQGVQEDLIVNFKVNPKLISYIYNPVDINYINSLKCELIEDEYLDIFNEKTIITAGRLTYQKGQKHLIKAFNEVKKIIPDSNLVILGDGELRLELEGLIKKYKLEDSVHLLGFKANLFKYINKSGVFVLSSMFEGFGNVITEAMASGTVVISTDCKSGPKEILNPVNINMKSNDIIWGEYGIITPLFKDSNESDEIISIEEKKLADAIIKILNDNNLKQKYKNKINERIKNFDVNSIVKQWCDL